MINGNLEVVDISDPPAPVFQTTFTDGLINTNYIRRMEQYLIITEKMDQPVFVDISDPASPLFYGRPITDDVNFEKPGLLSSGEYL